MNRNLKDLRNVDARHLRAGKPWARKGSEFVVSTINTAFTVPGAVLFVIGMLFALTLAGRFQ